MLEVYLEQETADVDKQVVDRWVWDHLTTVIDFPIESFDHYMYVMPGNVEFGGEICNIDMTVY